MSQQRQDLKLIEEAVQSNADLGQDDGGLSAFDRLFGRDWISCSRKLPAVGAPVWILLNTLCHPRVRAGRYTGGVLHWQEDERPGGGPFWAPLNAITHWMPRFVDEAPEPPPVSPP